MANGAWVVQWTESERGWGKRPDGCWPGKQAKLGKLFLMDNLANFAII